MCDRANADRDPPQEPLTIVEEAGAFIVFQGERALTAPFWHRDKAQAMLELLQAKQNFNN
jgi:hypothetical protein